MDFDGLILKGYVMKFFIFVILCVLCPSVITGFVYLVNWIVNLII